MTEPVQAELSLDIADLNRNAEKYIGMVGGPADSANQQLHCDRTKWQFRGCMNRRISL